MYALHAWFIDLVRDARGDETRLCENDELAGGPLHRCVGGGCGIPSLIPAAGGNAAEISRHISEINPFDRPLMLMVPITIITIYTRAYACKVVPGPLSFPTHARAARPQHRAIRY